MRALLRSEERADQLEARSIHLASLQFGVLATLVETLALRDRSTARHAAAVGRYARELAAAAGLDERTQELAHTAGLLHDIGKFALPDRILQADVLDDADWALIRRHPQEGATLVGRLDGYGEVAESILYHHERIDGEGYPAGLIGTEIPLASRMIAICSTFDAMTARDSYRTPMSPQDAITELRRVAGPPARRGTGRDIHRDAPTAWPHRRAVQRGGELRGGARLRPPRAGTREPDDVGPAPCPCNRPGTARSVHSNAARLLLPEHFILLCRTGRGAQSHDVPGCLHPDNTVPRLSGSTNPSCFGQFVNFA